MIARAHVQARVKARARVKDRPCRQRCEPCSCTCQLQIFFPVHRVSLAVVEAAVFRILMLCIMMSLG